MERKTKETIAAIMAIIVLIAIGVYLLWMAYLVFSGHAYLLVR